MLGYMEKKPVCRIHTQPYDAPYGAWSMAVVRGLERRGLVEERKGLWHITDAGRALCAGKNLRAENAKKETI